MFAKTKLNLWYSLIFLELNDIIRAFKDGARYGHNKAIDDCIIKVNAVLIGHDYVVTELESLKL